MVRYWYAWTPLIIIGTLVFLSLPWLGLIALLVGALVPLVALAVLAWAVVVAPYRLARAVGRRWLARTGSAPRPASAWHNYRQPYAYTSTRTLDYSAPQLGASANAFSATAGDGASSHASFRKEELS